MFKKFCLALALCGVLFIVGMSFAVPTGASAGSPAIERPSNTMVPCPPPPPPKK